MKIYMVITVDGHGSVDIFPFGSPEIAINTAIDLAHGDRSKYPKDVEQSKHDGWMYHSGYSQEGAWVGVLIKTLDTSNELAKLVQIKI